MRFHSEVFKEIRRKVGEDYPILIKHGVEDHFPGGLNLEEGKRAAKYLAEMGFDALEISSGVRKRNGWEGTEFRTGINRLDQEAYYRNWCGEIKSEVRVSVMLVGGLKSFDLMEEIVQRGEADFVSISRPLIREPHRINDWMHGDCHRARCISCNQCLGVVTRADGTMLHCVQLKKKSGVHGK